MLANPFDMNVSTFGSLLLRLSHHRNGLSTHPPSVLGTFPSKFPRDRPNRSATRSAGAWWTTPPTPSSGRSDTPRRSPPRRLSSACPAFTYDADYPGTRFDYG